MRRLHMLQTQRKAARSSLKRSALPSVWPLLLLDPAAASLSKCHLRMPPGSQIHSAEGTYVKEYIKRNFRVTEIKKLPSYGDGETSDMRRLRNFPLTEF